MREAPCWEGSWRKWERGPAGRRRGRPCCWHHEWLTWSGTCCIRCPAVVLRSDPLVLWHSLRCSYYLPCEDGDAESLAHDQAGW